MRHLRRLGNQMAIPIPPDDKGYIGRECPECEQYFKITLGTGIAEGNPSATVLTAATAAIRISSSPKPRLSTHNLLQ